MTEKRDIIVHDYGTRGYLHPAEPRKAPEPERQVASGVSFLDEEIDLSTKEPRPKRARA